jgi:hypothetical protein
VAKQLSHTKGVYMLPTITKCPPGAAKGSEPQPMRRAKGGQMNTYNRLYRPAPGSKRTRPGDVLSIMGGLLFVPKVIQASK